MFRSFFNYPDQNDNPETQNLILLPNWSEDKWNTLLKYAERRRFKAGDRVVTIGDTDRSFYIIVEGTLDVLIPRGRDGSLHSTQTREAGAVIGEQAFIDGNPRSATIAARSDGEMLRVSIESFEILAAHHPDLARDILFDLARVLSIKLRQANNFISKWVK